MEFKSYKEIKNVFLQNFFRLCDENKLSLSYIIEKTGVSKINLHNYRYNNKKIAEEKIFEMAVACKINVIKVFTLQSK